LTETEPDRKAQFAQAMSALINRVRGDARVAPLAGGLMALVAALIIVFHQPKAATPAVNPPSVAKAPKPTKPIEKATPPVGYAIEKPVAIVAPPATLPKPVIESEPEPADIAAEPSPDSTPLPVAKIKSKNAMLQVTSTPTGASFEIYPGVIAGKTAPTASPLRSGSTPGSIEDLPPGRYTLFFRNTGWPDDRAEISVSAGENVPIDYTFPHGTATITSMPDGAEIFLGTQSLGTAPLTVDLPLGKQKLMARLANYPDRTQTATIGSDAPATVTFQMRMERSRSRPKATPTPSALDKIGQSFKHIFGSKEPTPAPRKRR
jgi:hypothetical protein